MKLICPHSGEHYHTSHGYGTASSIHPATQVPLKKLVAQLPDYTAERTGINTDTDRYFYLLSWFNSLPSVTYRAPASKDRDYPVLLAHQDVLFKTVLAVQQYPRIDFPAVVVSTQSTIQGCLRNWLEAFQSIVSDQKIRAKTQRRNIEVARIEETLDRITSHHTSNSTPRSAKLVASWAAKVADFPTELVTAPNGNGTITLSELWQNLIHQSFMDSPLSLLSANILPADLSELIEYCEDNVPHGTQHAYQLMKRLRAMESLLNELSGKPNRAARVEPNLSRNTYNGESNVIATTAHKSQGKPHSAVTGQNTNGTLIAEPIRSTFTTTIEYLKAKVRWQQSVLEAREDAMIESGMQLMTRRGKYAEL